MVNIAIIRDVTPPNRAHKTDAGLDFYIPNDWNNNKSMTLAHGDSVIIPCGIKMNLEHLNMMKFDNKSGISTKLGLLIGACIIDVPYQGELHINLIKATTGICIISPGDKIAQGIFYDIKYYTPVIVNEKDLFSSKSARGDGGFGSTGL
jgi:deoxyuridine 5'-triphosphate nucleotidohydrolase